MAASHWASTAQLARAGLLAGSTFLGVRVALKY